MTSTPAPAPRATLALADVQANSRAIARLHAPAWSKNRPTQAQIRRAIENWHDDPDTTLTDRDLRRIMVRIDMVLDER